MKGFIFFAAGILAVGGCAKQPLSRPLESFSAELRSASSTETSPVSVTAEFERNDGINYLRFRLKNISNRTLSADPGDLPWAEYDTTLGLVGFDRDTGYQISGVPPRSGGMRGNSPVAIAPGETLEGRILLSEFFARDKQNAPAPTDRDLIVLWSYRFREHQREAKKELTKGAPMEWSRIEPGVLSTGVFLIPKE